MFDYAYGQKVKIYLHKWRLNQQQEKNCYQNFKFIGHKSNQTKTFPINEEKVTQCTTIITIIIRKISLPYNISV